MVQAGGGDVKNKIINEKANPVADVVFGLNNFYLEQIVAAGAVEAYKPSWSDKTDPPAQGDPSGKGYYWPIVQQGIVLPPYKADAALKPADWSDLWSKPEWKDKYEVPTSVTGATTQLAIAGILSRYRDDRGENGISAEGWNAIKPTSRTAARPKRESTCSSRWPTARSSPVRCSPPVSSSGRSSTRSRSS